MKGISMPLGLSKTWDAIKNANGPAQHIMYGIWGFIIAGMYVDMGVPNLLVFTWAAFSMITILAVVWCSKNILKNILLVDVLLTAIVLGLYVSNTHFVVPDVMEPVYYTIDITGKMSQSMRGHMDHSVATLGEFTNLV